MDTVLETELKPCPFCGSKAKVWHGISLFWVQCQTCFTASNTFDKEVDAVKAWNKKTWKGETTMTEKSRLAEILGLEEDEEFTIKEEREGERATYRIHNGIRECKDTSDVWRACGYEHTLAKIINDPSLIQKKPRFTDEETTVLRWLHKHGNLEYLCKGLNGKPYADTIGNFGLALNVADYLLKPGESVDLNEMFGSITDEDRGR